MPSPKFIITKIDGSEETYPLRPRAQVQFEEETGEPLTTLSGDEMRVSSLYRLAWYAAGQPDEFDTWLDNLDSVDLQSPEGAADEGVDETRPT